MSNPYDKVAQFYDKAFPFKTSLIEDELIYGWLKHFLCKSNILDLGCGTASFLEHFAWNDYVGIDSSKQMLKIAKKKFPKHSFIQCDMRNLPFRFCSFDNVISLYSPISYAGKKGIVEANNILRKGGKFFHMVYSKRYHTRKTYIMNRVKIKTHFTDYDGLATTINHKAKGFNSYGDAIERLPKKLIKILMKFDLSKIYLKLGYFTIMYGEKQ